MPEKITLHSSWKITWASLGILIGVALSLFVPVSSTLAIIIFVVCLLVVGWRSTVFVASVAFLGAGLLFGLIRGSGYVVAQSDLKNFIGSEVQLLGVVAEDPTLSVDGDLRLRLKQLRIDNQPYVGEVWVSTSQQLSVKRSDVVLLKGRLSEGFGVIPVAMYRANIQSVYPASDQDIALQVRDSFADGIRATIVEPQASLGAGFLLGQKSALPEKLDNELRLLGLTHIVVASGYNLTILVRFARRFLMRISRFSALSLSAGLVYSFTLITGWSPSMTRAGLITLLSLLAWYYGRKFHPAVLLTFSAAVTVVYNPTYAWGDIGWLLSFGAFIGVIVLAPLLRQFFWGDKQLSAPLSIFVETLSAQVFTLPIIMLLFGQFSPLSILSNMLIVPFIPLAMLLTFIAGIAGMLSPNLAFIGKPAELVMGYMVGVVDYLAQLPAASTEFSVNASLFISMYILLIVFIVFLKRRTGYNFTDYNVVE